MNLPDGLTLWDWAYFDGVSYESQLDDEGNYIGPVPQKKITDDEQQKGETNDE